MKLVLFLLSATTASAAHESLARQLIQRHVQSSDDLQALMNFQDSDWTCMMNGAEDESSCTRNNSNCFWCPLGSAAGACVSSEQSDAVNSMGIMHLQCGLPATPEDEDFWDNLVGCEMGGTTSENCLGNPMCTWCVVEEPAFGLCVTQEFFDEVKSLEEEANAGLRSPEEIIPMEDVLACSKEAPQDTSITSLLEFGCAMMGAFGEKACTTASDGAGNACIYQNSELFGELCLSATQTSVMSFLMDTMDEMDLDMDTLLGNDEEREYEDEEAEYDELEDSEEEEMYEDEVEEMYEDEEEDEEDEEESEDDEPEFGKSILSNLAHGDVGEEETTQGTKHNEGHRV